MKYEAEWNLKAEYSGLYEESYSEMEDIIGDQDDDEQLLRKQLRKAFDEMLN